MAEVIDGKAVGEEVVARVKALTAELTASGATQPGLAVVIVGEDPASQVYVASKSKYDRERASPCRPMRRATKSSRCTRSTA